MADGSPIDSPIDLGTRPPSTMLAEAPPEARQRLADALAAPLERRRDAVADVVAAWPAYLEGWAHLGDMARDEVESYACFRVGYHRGLDALRGAGWRGSGYVRWAVPSNRGFLLCLDGLAHAASSLGETEEAERCAQFIRQLEPTWAGRPAQ